MCDVGWSHHQGLAPTSNPTVYSPPDVPKALKCYELSASKGYSPAAGLLGDIYFYGEGASVPADPEKAKAWLEKVEELTSEDEPEDAYLRGKGMQKLGIIAHRKGEREEAGRRFNER